MRSLLLAALLAAFLASLGPGAGRAAPAPLWTVAGASLDWRAVAHGEQLLVARGALYALTHESSPFLLGSQIEFLARPITCVPRSAKTCFSMVQVLSQAVGPVETTLTFRAVLVSEASNSLTLAALASPAGQPRLVLSFAAAPRTLGAAQVHAGGLVSITLTRRKGGSSEDWNPYSWSVSSLHAVAAR
jgi:hypothetical protein